VALEPHGRSTATLSVGGVCDRITWEGTGTPFARTFGRQHTSRRSTNPPPPWSCGG